MADVRRWTLIVLLYLAAGLVALALINSDDGNWAIALALLATASFVLGWEAGTRTNISVFVPWTLVALGTLFGETNSLGTDGPMPVAAWAAWPGAVMSVVLVLLASGCHYLYERVSDRDR
jgi:hypothetical protein